ncbi:MAG: pitrilysin family protein [Acidobacteriota bacterium]
MIRGILLLLLTVFAAPPLPEPIEDKPVRFEVPKPRRAVLPNGVVVHMMEDRTLPTIEISAIFDVGTAADPDGLGGLVEVTAEAVRSGGAGERDGDSFEAALADLAALIELDAGVDITRFSVWSPAQSMGGALALFADLLRRPRLAGASVRTARERRAEALRRENDDPATLAFREFTRELFHDHPYGNWPTEAGLKKIGRGQVREFHGAHYGPASLTLTAAGDFDADELLDRLKSLFGDWEPDSPAETAVSDSKAVTGEDRREGGAPPDGANVTDWVERTVVPRALSQSTFVFGHRGPSWDHPDLPALDVLLEILSYYRYFLDVRDNRGLAYAAFGYFDERRQGGFFASFAGTRAESTGETIALMRRHLNEVAAGKFTDEEAQGARRFVSASFVHRFGTSARAVREFATAEIRGLPPDWLTGYTRRVEALRPDDLRRVAREHLHPDDLLLVIVGDPELIDPAPRP